MPYEPPWLNVNPSGLAEAAARGSQIRLEGQRIAQSAADAAGQRAVEMARMDTERQIQQQKIDLSTQLAARKFAAQQQYSQLVQQGMDPIEAMLHVGPAMAGGTETGLGTIATAQARMRQAAQPPTPVMDSSGRVVGYSGGNVRFMPRGAAPRMQPTDYTTVTEKTPAVPGAPAVQATPSDYSIWKPWTWGDEATPAKPAIPGVPERTTTRRIPNQPQGDGDIPQKAIDYLIAHPDAASEFDAKYGQGASEQYLQQ